ncbi:hypothetical protein GIB67_029592, partial [Kingdonia uniflora]
EYEAYCFGYTKGASVYASKELLGTALFGIVWHTNESSWIQMNVKVLHCLALFGIPDNHYQLLKPDSIKLD